MKNAKLFIWTEFSPDYTDGLAFAIAKDVRHAKRLVIKAHGFEPFGWGQMEVRSVDVAVARCVSGGG